MPGKSCALISREDAPPPLRCGLLTLPSRQQEGRILAKGANFPSTFVSKPNHYSFKSATPTLDMSAKYPAFTTRNGSCKAGHGSLDGELIDEVCNVDGNCGFGGDGLYGLFDF
jgi:hypothetical protein